MRESVWHERHLVGFGNRLKERDRVKGKVAESLALKGRTVAEAKQLIPDAIRYTFQYCEADYGRHLQVDVAPTEREGFEMVRLRNFWREDQYKGISSLWRDPSAGRLFEVQFHTEVSYHAMVFTAGRSHARRRKWTSKPSSARSTRTSRSRRAPTTFPATWPTQAGRFPEGGPIPGRTCSPITPPWSTTSAAQTGRPACLLRRSYRDGGRRDEAFTRDLVWHRSSLLISAERGDLENEFIEITADEAGRVADRIRRSATSRPGR